jgi:taurine dioxygenase
MSERLSITPLGPYIGAQVSGVDITRPLSDNQFEQLYHAVLRHQVVFLREQNITPEQQRDLALRFGDLHIHPVYPHAPGVDEIIVLDTHDDNPPDNDNWHTDVTFIATPPAGAILRQKSCLQPAAILCGPAALRRMRRSLSLRQLLSGLRAEHDFRKSFQEYKYRKTEEEHRRWLEAVAKNPPLLHPVVRTHPVTGKQALFVNEGFTTRIVDVTEKRARRCSASCSPTSQSRSFRCAGAGSRTTWRFGITASPSTTPTPITCRSGALCTGRRFSGISPITGRGNFCHPAKAQRAAGRETRDKCAPI